MTPVETAALIDLVRRTILGDESADAEMSDAADVIATEVVGELQSRFILIARPTQDDVADMIAAATGLPADREAEARVEVAVMAPGLFGFAGKATS